MIRADCAGDFHGRVQILGEHHEPAGKGINTAIGARDIAIKLKHLNTFSAESGLEGGENDDICAA